MLLFVAVICNNVQVQVHVHVQVSENIYSNTWPCAHTLTSIIGMLV